MGDREEATTAPSAVVIEAPATVARPETRPEVERPPAPAVEPAPGRRIPSWAWLGGILALATFVRVWEIGALGYNSDEAVYSGQAASIANDSGLEEFFPTFRAHPLLVQTLLSIGYHIDAGELFGRLVIAAMGVLTVFVVYKTGRLLYGTRAGLVAALFMAVMPYHAIVTRQVLLDGPMTLFATVALYFLARYAISQRAIWLYATGAAMGMTFLAKEGGIVLLGSIYAFLALTPEVRVRAKHLVGSLATMLAFVAVFPISLAVAGATSTGGNFLAWQLFRRPNHDLAFYPVEVGQAIGLLLILAAALGLWRLRDRFGWREVLLLSWIAVPFAFFELWAVKGFQYLLPIAPAFALLAARALTQTEAWRPFDSPRRGWDRLGDWTNRLREPRVASWAVAAVAVSLLIPTWLRIQPSDSDEFLAGSGGVPGGREAGEWIAANVPEGARLMTIGPSMANILQYYGRRKANGLSVSPNPLNRNPVYEPLDNPDRMIRDNELQYIVWDAFSARRSPFFSRKIQTYASRYNGRVAHSETIPATTPSGERTTKPIITIYEVRP